ncbi:MAG: RNA polymerase factor sigma-54 [Candidatus Poribacteria bacterium]|nr:RNA polymerase factor sigma-54 [Candidatus Poribacteria bacterium]
MKITPKLTQTQTQQQKIIMTPKLQQAIKVLMMPQLELKQFIEQELNQNPLLEIDDEYDTALSIEEYDPTPELNKPEENIDREDTSVDIDWQSVFDDMRVPTTNVNDQWNDRDAPEPDVAEALSLQNYLLQQLQLGHFSDMEREIGELIIGNLNDDGQLQLQLFSLPNEYILELESGDLSEELQQTLSKELSDFNNKKSSKKVDLERIFEIKGTDDPPNTNHEEKENRSWKIIDTTDGKTYTVKHEGCELNLYELTLEDIASEVNCSVADVENVLQTIQETFEPTGIAYRDLKETLSIQIRHHEMQHFKQNGQNPYDSSVPFHLAREIVENHLQDLLESRITSISQALNVDKSIILKASQWISTLSPYPGRYFSDPSVKDLVKSPETIEGITPDVQIVNIDDEYYILPFDNYIPRLRMNPYYINLMREENNTLDSESKKWIQKKYNDATDLLSSIAQRGRTIERVTEAIFKIQSDFLTEGPQSIKPLTLKTIADMAGVHESTVSRVTSSKYVQTPIGTYPLKFFFSNQLATTHGDSVSSEHVKAEIKELISKENHKKPLSDQAISTSLKKEGIVIARRTVQKYREELGILSSRQRKNLDR